jgi:hypothetical protein
MPVAKKSHQLLGMLGLLACMIVSLACSVAGCSPGGELTLSPAAQAKAQETFKKRFANVGEKSVRKAPRR